MFVIPRVWSGPVRSGPIQSGFHFFPVRSGFDFKEELWVYKLFFSLCLSIGTVLERLLLKNAAQQRTSQCVKLRSRARVMIIFDRSVARSLGRSVARSFGRSVARSLARSLGHSLGRLVARSLGRSVARLLDHSITRSLDRSIARSLDRSIARSLDRSVARSLGRSKSIDCPSHRLSSPLGGLAPSPNLPAFPGGFGPWTPRPELRRT